MITHEQIEKRIKAFRDLATSTERIGGRHEAGAIRHCARELERDLEAMTCQHVHTCRRRDGAQCLDCGERLKGEAHARGRVRNEDVQRAIEALEFAKDTGRRALSALEGEFGSGAHVEQLREFDQILDAVIAMLERVGGRLLLLGSIFPLDDKARTTVIGRKDELQQLIEGLLADLS